MISKVKLTVLFNDPFWIGIFELIVEKEYKVCKVTFGTEPKDEDIYELILQKFYLLNFSSPLLFEEVHIEKRINPKRLQRSIRNEISSKGICTKAQIAIELQHEQGKVQSKKKSKEQKELESQKRLFLKKKKRLEKHKGH